MLIVRLLLKLMQITLNQLIVIEFGSQKTYKTVIIIDIIINIIGKVIYRKNLTTF